VRKLVHWSRVLLTGFIFGLPGAGIDALATSEAQAGSFGVREQSAYFLGTAFAGSAAGGQISSVFWNSAATAALPGCNSSSNYTAVFSSGDETARAGAFVTGVPPIAAGLTPTSTDIGRDGFVPSSYVTCQLSDRFYAGLGLNAPFGLLTKPDNTTWAGSPVAITSRIFSVDINPTLAYKLTPELTVGVGVQIEYFQLRLTHGPFNSLIGPLSGSRSFDANDWGVGATAGVLWQPNPGTSVGLGYRSAVGIDASGSFDRSAGQVPAVSTHATASVTLPDELTLSARQIVGPRLVIMGTVEWQNWSRLQNVAAVGSGCGAGGVCEVLNLNYRDGWFYSLGAEYAYSPTVLLRAGVGYETSPIQDSTRDILIPDSNRIFLSAGASYKYSEQISVDLGYSHLFFQDAPFCIADPTRNNGTSHCNAGTAPTAVLLRGSSDNSADLVAVGLRYKF
jgi:long-chain fatty acid transport protein